MSHTESASNGIELQVVAPADQEVVTLRAEVERLREVAHQAEVDRDDFAQAMWDARGILGFDQDGDASPHYPNPADYIRFFLADMREMRKDYDDACDEIHAAEYRRTTGADKSVEERRARALDRAEGAPKRIYRPSTETP